MFGRWLLIRGASQSFWDQAEVATMKNKKWPKMAVFTKWPILAKLNHRPNFFIRYIERRHRKVQHTTRWTKLNREKVLQFDPNVENRRPQNCRFARAASADPKHRRSSFITLNWGEDSHLSQELKDFVLLQRIRSQWSNRNRQFWKIISRKQRWWWSREAGNAKTQCYTASYERSKQDKDMGPFLR